MSTTKFYLDTRAWKKGKPAPLKLAITKKGSTALLPLNVNLLPEQWDKKAGKVVNHPNKAFLNTYIQRRKLDCETELLGLISSGVAARMTATELKNHIAGLREGNNEESRLFMPRLKKFADAKKGSTKQIYMHTYGRIQAFAENCELLKFEDITKDWLYAFDNFLSLTSPSKNARNIHLRNIRAVFNDAIDDEITNFYPFRRFKIRPVPTASSFATSSSHRRAITSCAHRTPNSFPTSSSVKTTLCESIRNSLWYVFNNPLIYKYGNTYNSYSDSFCCYLDCIHIREQF